MSNSKPLPPFTFDVLCYLNRDKLDRFSVVCRPLKNFIDRYFHSKPYRVFDGLEISGGSYALKHNNVQWHPNRDDYSVQQFLDGQKCSRNDRARHSFSEMHPYLGPTIRIRRTIIYIVTGDSLYNPNHIAEMESIAYLWRDYRLRILNAKTEDSRIVAEDFKPILNSPTILQCRNLLIHNARFSFKDYKVLYNVKIIETYSYDEKIDPSSWQQFLEQPGDKPIIVFRYISHECASNLLDGLSKAFSSAVLPSAFKIVFSQCNKPLTEFRETNNISGEILELKKGHPTGYQDQYLKSEYYVDYTLERSGI